MGNTPSWKVHEIVGRALLGFYDREIDEIVDSLQPHDSSRYEVSWLADAVGRVESKWGREGVKQLILHHYLDRVSDILVSEVAQHDLYESAREVVEAVRRRVDEDPGNILDLLIKPLDSIRWSAWTMYSGRSRRAKRRIVKERIDRAYRELLENPGLKRLAPLVREVVALVKDNIELILCSILIYDERIATRITQALTIKTLANYYRIYGLEKPKPRITGYEIRGYIRIIEDLVKATCGR